MQIIFMGTSEFAVPILNSLIHSQHSIKSVYTVEPKLHSRGMKLHCSPVYKVAEKHQIPIFTPKTFKNQSEVDKLKEIEADIIVVAAYGLIIPASILNACKFGCINVHPSELPRWRGAAPMQGVHAGRSLGRSLQHCEKGLHHDPTLCTWRSWAHNPGQYGQGATSPAYGTFR